MKPSFCKAKGRKLQNWVCERISKLLGIPWGKDELIASRPMGQSGVDVVLKGDALKMFPYSVECKNTEKWSVPSWVEQAKKNKKENTAWVVIAKRNRDSPIVIMSAKTFFRLASNQRTKPKRTT